VYGRERENRAAAPSAGGLGVCVRERDTHREK